MDHNPSTRIDSGSIPGCAQGLNNMRKVKLLKWQPIKIEDRFKWIKVDSGLLGFFHMFGIDGNSDCYDTIAVIEFEDGSVVKYDPELIQFCEKNEN